MYTYVCRFFHVVTETGMRCLPIKVLVVVVMIVVEERK